MCPVRPTYGSGVQPLRCRLCCSKNPAAYPATAGLQQHHLASGDCRRYTGLQRSTVYRSTAVYSLHGLQHSSALEQLRPRGSGQGIGGHCQPVDRANAKSGADACFVKLFFVKVSKSEEAKKTNAKSGMCGSLVFCSCRKLGCRNLECKVQS